MRAVVFKAPREVGVEDVPDPRAEQDDDVVVWVTSSALCGTDLHMYDGPACSPPPTRRRPPTVVTPTGHCRSRGRRCSTRASPSAWPPPRPPLHHPPARPD